MLTEKWKTFCAKAAEMMQSALDDRISIKELDRFFSEDPTVSNEELRQYIVYVICEVDGMLDVYSALHDSFKNSLSEDQIVQRLGPDMRRIRQWPWN